MRKLLAFFFLFVFALVFHQTALAQEFHHVTIPRVFLREGASTNWSGFAALTSLTNPQRNAVSDVQARWTVPTLLCGSLSTYSSAWVGIDGYSNSTVEQTGTEHDCINGQPQYATWFEMYPKFPKNTPVVARAGDTFFGHVHYNTSNNSFTLTLTNETLGQTFSTVQKITAKRQSAEWIVEAPSSFSGVLPLTNFGTVTVASAQATINNSTGPINNPAWKFDPITMTTGSTTKSLPSALSTDGTSFSVTWLHQ